MVHLTYSLHSLVEKWLAPSNRTSARVTLFTHLAQKGCCYVRVEAARPQGIGAMLFFRHDDGNWYIFPPGRQRPAMNALRYAA